MPRFLKSARGSRKDKDVGNNLKIDENKLITYHVVVSTHNVTQ